MDYNVAMDTELAKMAETGEKDLKYMDECGNAEECGVGSLFNPLGPTADISAYIKINDDSGYIRSITASAK